MCPKKPFSSFPFLFIHQDGIKNENNVYFSVYACVPNSEKQKRITNKIFSHLSHWFDATIEICSQSYNTKLHSPYMWSKTFLDYSHIQKRNWFFVCIPLVIPIWIENKKRKREQRKQSNAKQNRQNIEKDSSFISETAFDQVSEYECEDFFVAVFMMKTRKKIARNNAPAGSRQIVNQIWHKRNKQKWGKRKFQTIRRIEQLSSKK